MCLVVQPASISCTERLSNIDIDMRRSFDSRRPSYATEFIPLLQDQVYDELVMINMQTRSNLVRSIQLRLAGPLDVQAAVRHALAEVDPDASVLGAVSFGERVRQAFNADRLIARLTELYGLLVLVLAAVAAVEAHQCHHDEHAGIWRRLGGGLRRL